MYKLGYFIFALIHVALIFKYQYSFVDAVVMLLMLMFAYQYFKTIKNLKGNIFTIFFIFYITCSTSIVSLLEKTSNGFYKDYISPKEFYDLSIWGSQVLLVFLIVILLYIKLAGKNSIRTEKSHRNIISSFAKDIEKLYLKYMVFVFGLEAITMSLGIAGAHFEAEVVLPFHLNGIIDEIRTNITPFIFALYLYDRFSKGKTVTKKGVVCFLLYAFVEVIVRNSKGALMMVFLPAIVLMSLMGKVNATTIRKYLAPLVIAFVITYPIIESARGDGQISIRSLISASKTIDKVDSSEKSSSYIRTFLTGVYYTKIYEDTNQDRFSFDFHLLPVVLLNGGGAGYMTRVIDGVPEDHHHSSGITGLCEALIWGGYLLCFIIVAIYAIIACIGDRGSISKKHILYSVILFFFFYDRIVSDTCSFVISPLFLPSMVSIILKIIIVKYYSKHFEQSYI